jgi:hypothetical protein
MTINFFIKKAPGQDWLFTLWFGFRFRFSGFIRGFQKETAEKEDQDPLAPSEGGKDKESPRLA